MCGSLTIIISAYKTGDDQGSYQVWKFNQEKALAWLEERVGRVAKVLQRQAIDLTQVQNFHQA